MTFTEFERRWPDCRPALLNIALRSLPRREQEECWRELAECCRLKIDAELELDRQREEEWPPPTRHPPARQSTPAATSQTPSAVALATDDPLKKIRPRVYVEALAGEVVPANGWLRCPLPDHEDTTPSFQVLESHWRCFGCGRGGGVIDLAAALYGIQPRRAGYWRLRDLILERLLWAPIPPKGDR